ncbi:600_t:CDS:2 [Ambispora gerdemannii]|uniref:3'(2'),5'-bisphosphate nucleotidase n=1 Tax=Ambispora gerdemannii TaxID=144530 RepID=A0A9N8Z0G4_9GLOM|nr:600_t:CDS:2 [Ambispora gerdemannii]
MSAFALERSIAINAVLQASKVCQTVFRHLASAGTITKLDKSPVTVADYSAQAVINTILEKSFPNDPIAGEEDSKNLHGDERKPLRQRILELTNTVLDEPLDENKLLNAIDRGTHPGGIKGRMWTLDPIDGTMGFLRGEQFAVCLALIIDGQVELGVMGCPNLPFDLKNQESEKGCLFVAVKGQGAFQRKFSSPDVLPIHFANISSPSEATFCESVESGHSAHGDAAKVAALLGISKPPLRMDSQCKYCCVSRGDANIYLRLPTSSEYIENIWDHASGSLLVNEAGGTISDIYGKALDFSLGRKLTANTGVVVSHPNIHSQILDAVQKVIVKKENI